MSTIPGRFRTAPWTTRWFLRLRWWLTPYRKMTAHLPSDGSVLDLGCGHGLFAFAAAEGAPRRTVIGIDHDAPRIALAREAAHDLPGLTFATGDILSPPDGQHAAVALIDLMHYFTPEDQERLLHNAFDRLQPGGRLILREVDPQHGPASLVNRVYEKIVTTIGFTRTRKEGFHFRTRQQWEAAMEHAGFRATSMPLSFFLFADVLFVGEKP
jgi:Methylase involved in ubiquinone/menaquinone biosynthesis